MEEEMIHRFLITIANTTPICQRAPPKRKIIQGKDSPINCYPQKKCHPLRNFNFTNILPRKIGDRCTLNLIVIGPNIKLAIPIEASIENITPNTPRNLRVNEHKEREGSL